MRQNYNSDLRRIKYLNDLYIMYHNIIIDLFITIHNENLEGVALDQFFDQNLKPLLKKMKNIKSLLNKCLLHDGSTKIQKISAKSRL